MVVMVLAVKPLDNTYSMFPSPEFEISDVHIGLQRRAVKFQ